MLTNEMTYSQAIEAKLRTPRHRPNWSALAPAGRKPQAPAASGDGSLSAEATTPIVKLPSVPNFGCFHLDQHYEEPLTLDDHGNWQLKLPREAR